MQDVNSPITVKELKKLLSKCKGDDYVEARVYESENGEVTVNVFVSGREPQTLLVEEFHKGTITCPSCGNAFIVTQSVRIMPTYRCPRCGAKI